jgi:hypothetical protein
LQGSPQGGIQSPPTESNFNHRSMVNDTGNHEPFESWPAESAAIEGGVLPVHHSLNPVRT